MQTHALNGWPNVAHTVHGLNSRNLVKEREIKMQKYELTRIGKAQLNCELNTEQWESLNDNEQADLEVLESIADPNSGLNNRVSIMLMAEIASVVRLLNLKWIEKVFGMTTRQKFDLLEKALETKMLPCIGKDGQKEFRYVKVEEFMFMHGMYKDAFLAFKHHWTRCYIHLYPNTGAIKWDSNRANFTKWDMEIS